MDAFAAYTLTRLLSERPPEHPYTELHRTPDLSVGLYVLQPGSIDRQQPHTEDEIYVVLAGHSAFTAGAETRAVGPGDTLFVGAGVPHRFHEITDELQVIVAFGPAEGSRAES